MFIYAEKDTESEKRIKNNNLYYKHTPKYKNTLRNKKIENSYFSKMLSSKLSAFYADFYGNIYILYIFVYFVHFSNLFSLRGITYCLTYASMLMSSDPIGEELFVHIVVMLHHLAQLFLLSRHSTIHAR